MQIQFSQASQADLLKTGSTASFQQSILSLEKCEEPFDKQIDIACTILDIDLLSQWNECMDSACEGSKDYKRQHSVPTSDPRPAYTLKWLLKKMQSVEETACIPRLNFRAWILLRVLLLRTPLAGATQLLRSLKFMESLEASLSWLSERTRATLKTSVKKGNGHGESSDSSSPTLDSSSNEGRSSRKRKRGDAGTVDNQAMTSFSGGHELASPGSDSAQVLFVAICCTISRLQRLCEVSDYSKGYPVEHLKFIMRIPSEKAAAMLGHSVNIANYFIHNCHGKISSESIFQISQGNAVYGTCVTALGKLWLDRFQGRQKVSDQANNV